MKTSLQNFLALCQFLALNQKSEIIENLRGEIRRDTIDWGPIVLIANEHLVSPILWVSLVNKNLDPDLPPDLKYYLSGLHNLNLQRNVLIMKQAEEIITSFNKIGIQPIFLKGGAFLLTGVFKDPGSRIMEDLDIMVEPADVERSWGALLDLGYRKIDSDEAVDQRSHHLPAVARDGDPAAIELHTQLFDYYDRTMVLNAEVCFRDAVEIDSKVGVFRVLSVPHSIIHNMTHMEIHHLYFFSGKISLRSLMDFAALADSGLNATCWKSIESMMNGHGLKNVFGSYLLMASNLVHAPVPEDFRPTLRDKMHFKRRQFVYDSNRLQGISWFFTDPLRSYRIVKRNLTLERLNTLNYLSDGTLGLIRSRLKYLWFLFRKYVLNNRLCI